jgi:hypothetical protein
MAMRIATLINSGSSTNNTTSTGAVTKDRLCGGLPKRWLQPVEIIACVLLGPAKYRSSPAIPESDWGPLDLVSADLDRMLAEASGSFAASQ